MRNLFNATSVTWKFNCAACGFENKAEVALLARTGHIPYVSLPEGWYIWRDFVLCPLHTVEFQDHNEAIEQRREMKLRIEYGA